MNYKLFKYTISIQYKKMSSNSSNLFVEVSTKTAILLVDRSGSTNSQFNNKGRDLTTIFTKMGQICNELPHDNFYVIYWSSPDYNESSFIGGVSVVPFKVSKGTSLTAIFTKIASSCDGSGTCPSIGFKSIRPEWLAENPMVYLITDGQIGCSVMRDTDNKAALVNEITRLNAQFSIIAVENIDRNFANIENVNSAAGGDIYNIVATNRLTGKLSKFISHSPSGRFVQIDKIKPLDGHAPYGNCCFSVKRVAEFIAHIRDEIQRDPSEDNQINIAQRLSSTLEVLTRDKPRRLMNDIIRTFSSLFTLDNNIIKYLMLDAVDKERGGSAQVIANYRQNLKNLFAQASSALRSDVSDAIGLSDVEMFVSPVLNGNIMVGHYRNADKTIHIRNDVYKRAGWHSNVPVLPMLQNGSPVHQLKDQCLRQWLRCIFAELYNISAVSDHIIYLVLCSTLYVCKTSNDIHVNAAYQEFARCMLRKGRLNTDKTEFDILLEGNLPTTNSGSHEEFVKMLTESMSLIGIVGEWGECWYAICSLLSSELAAKQLKHCGLSSGLNGGLTFGAPVNIIKESETNIYDYNCLITLEDLSDIGGYKILSHRFGNSSCNPIYLLSTNGMRELLEKSPECPVCYTTLTERDFHQIGPKVNVLNNANFDTGKFKANVVSASSSNLSASFSNLSVSAQSNQNAKRSSGSSTPIRNVNNKTGTLIIMKGTVGAGKTTYSAFIKQEIERRGGVCLVVGTDKYCVKGLRVPDAIQKVREELESIRHIDNDDIIIIIDTCGEQSHKNSMNNVFGVNFTNWHVVNVWPNLDRNNKLGYLCWTLMNVLNRCRTTPDSQYWLNPAEAGQSTCCSVHTKKAKALGLLAKGTNLNNMVEVKRNAEQYAINSIKPFVMPEGV